MQYVSWLRQTLLLAVVIFVLGCGDGPRVKRGTGNGVIPDDPIEAPTATRDIAEQLALDICNLDLQPQAIEKLVALGRDANKAIPLLLEALKDTTNSGAGKYIPGRGNSVREGAILVLTKMGQACRNYVVVDYMPLLIKGLKDPDPAVREHTAFALAHLKEGAAAAAPELLRLASEQEQLPRQAALKTLEAIGPPHNKDVLKLMLSPIPEVRLDAASALSWLELHTESDARMLAEVLLKKDERLYSPILKALERMGAKGAVAIDAIITTFDAEELGQRSSYSTTLWHPGARLITTYGEVAIPSLINALKDDSFRIRLHAVRTLFNMSRKVIQPATEALTKLLDDPHTEVALLGAVTLLRMQETNEQAIERMKAAITKGDATTREMACYFIGRLSRGGQSLAPLLIQPLQDEKSAVRYEAGNALVRLMPTDPQVIAALAKITPRTEKGRLRIARVIELSGPAAQHGLPIILPGLTSTDSDTRVAMANIIAFLGPLADLAGPILLKGLLAPDRQPHEQVMFIQALGSLGKLPENTAQTARELLTSPSPEVRAAAVILLGQCGESALPWLSEMLNIAQKDSAVATRAAAYRGISLLGPKAKSIASELKLLNHNSNPIRPWAQIVLIAIGEASDELAVDLLQILNNSKQPYPRIMVLDGLDLLPEEIQQKFSPSVALALEDPNSTIRLHAIEAVGRSKLRGKGLLLGLTNSLHPKDPKLAKAAAVTIREFGPAAEVALGQLQRFADLSSELGIEAMRSISRIRYGK